MLHKLPTLDETQFPKDPRTSTEDEIWGKRCVAMSDVILMPIQEAEATI